jgi:hypothetical protein
MKRLACAMTLSVLAGLLWAPLVLAATAYTDTLQGVEISPGIIIGNTRVGTTFVGIATGQRPGTWAISLNYTPPRPGPNVTNTIVTGTWELAVFQNRRLVGRLFGTVANGTASWIPGGTVAAVSANLTVTRGTGAFVGARGTGTFKGTLSHLTFPPRIGGALQLSY